LTELNIRLADCTSHGGWTGVVVTVLVT